MIDNRSIERSICIFHYKSKVKISRN